MKSGSERHVIYPPTGHLYTCNLRAVGAEEPSTQDLLEGPAGIDKLCKYFEVLASTVEIIGRE